MGKRESIADQLRKEILACGKSVNAVSIESGIPQPVLHRFVKGERDLTLTTAEKLIQYFDLELRRRDEAPNGP
jgi:plasmid maintenance system antidote protein VapI